MATKELQQLRLSYTAAFAAYMTCLTKVAEACQRGQRPPEDVVRNEQMAFSDLIDARKALDKAATARRTRSESPAADRRTCGRETTLEICESCDCARNCARRKGTKGQAVSRRPSLEDQCVDGCRRPPRARCALVHRLNCTDAAPTWARRIVAAGCRRPGRNPGRTRRNIGGHRLRGAEWKSRRCHWPRTRRHSATRRRACDHHDLRLHKCTCGSSIRDESDIVVRRGDQEKTVRLTQIGSRRARCSPALETLDPIRPR